MSCLLAKPNTNAPNCHENDFCYCDMEKKEKEIQALKEKLEKAVEVIKNASNYLDATYDIHTLKDEPEYQMMMNFREVLKELEGGE